VGERRVRPFVSVILIEVHPIDRQKRNMSKPEKVFKMGAVRASIFCNIIQRDGVEIPIRKVVIEVRYKDKTGQWQGTNSLSLNEVPKAIAALQQAYEYLVSDSRHSAEPDGNTGPAEPVLPGPPTQPPTGGYPRIVSSKHY